MIALKSILVPTDFSETSMVAVRYGAALARAFGARLSLLHVVHESFTDDIIAATSLGMLEVAGKNARVRLTRLLSSEDERALRPEHVVRTGPPDTEIVDYAREHDVDLIVVATRGRSAVAHIIEGSVAERLLRRAPCPVLIVRHPEHEFVLPETAVS